MCSTPATTSHRGTSRIERRSRLRKGPTTERENEGPVDTTLFEDIFTQDLAWQEMANCRGADQDLFFPERGASTRKAKAICGACAVKDDCLEFAITKGERFGIWGGMSERERRRIRRQRAITARQTG